MNDLTQSILQQFGGAALQQLSGQIGADEQSTGNALSAAVPLLISALTRNASTEDGAQALHGAISSGGHDGSILDNIGGLISNPMVGNGLGILGHLLGGQQQQQQVAHGLGQSTGLDASQIGQILQIAAPLVLGALGKQQQSQGLDASGLAGLLMGQQQQAQQAAPGLMGIVSNLLDSNHDGSPLDEMLGFAAQFLKGR
jgi:hypothetical protein